MGMKQKLPRVSEPDAGFMDQLKKIFERTGLEVVTGG